MYSIAVPLVMIFSIPSLSAADEANGSALGLGSEPCSVFISTYEHNDVPAHDDDNPGAIHMTDEGTGHYTSSDYINWLQGYLSSYNIHEYDGDNVASKASTGGMLYFLYRRCSENPDAAFHSVLPLLLERIKPGGQGG